MIGDRRDLLREDITSDCFPRFNESLLCFRHDVWQALRGGRGMGTARESINDACSRYLAFGW